jgi:SAM-dependent methyltransferase
VVAVDASERSLELAKAHAKAFKVDSGVSFVLGNLEHDDTLRRVAELGPYDLVYAYGMLHHTPDPEVVLFNLRMRCMREDSELRAMVYAHSSWKRIMIDAGLDQPETQSGCPLARTYTNAGLLRLLSASGFAADRVWQTHLFPYSLPEYAERRELVLAPWFREMPAAMFDALQRELGWHLLTVAHPSIGGA